VFERLVRNCSGRGTIGNGLGIDGAVGDRLGERGGRSRQVINLKPLKELKDGFVVVEVVVYYVIR
jgi:hypothetical protein